MCLFNKFSNKFLKFLSHLLAIYMFHLDSVLSERFLWMPLFFDFPGFFSPPLDSSIFHTRTPLAFPAVIQCISACSQLIAAQQLIVITDTCGTPTLWGVFPHRGKSPANSRITLNPPMNATDPPLPPHTHTHTYHLQPALRCRLSVCGFDCHLMCCDYDVCSYLPRPLRPQHPLMWWFV